MKKKIIVEMAEIEIMEASLDTKIKDITVQDICVFNPTHAHIEAAMRSLEKDCVLLQLKHDEFEPIYEGYQIPVFNLRRAGMIYPFLFADTNPILYRRF